ncbi:D-glycero-alpha-D-manno-heptose-1,7-bisphosphate 7-phosphatase [Helicobacter burdigaliensis]|uniref:D-glycero-alpha-D-manno-heptose-1,7-bisphosphate 7-phosphatase n=1 Tax=Helicobacter burdigaliensis TaxID=2315334 RepID=UPI000EF67E65|nr:HAD-IIIA family hydrolase [Helicobacter burdigaliensis]
MKRKVVFFDRDGVVNLEDSPYSFKIETFFFAPGFMELFLELKKQDSLCIMVTNQSGINRGLFTKEDLLKLHTFVQNAINSMLTIPLRKSGFVPKNIGFDGIYYCPHTKEEGCLCRKPQSKMLQDACEDFRLNLDDYESYILGDKDTDMQAGKAVGVKNRIYIGEGEAPNSTHQIKSIQEALKIIL